MDSLNKCIQGIMATQGPGDGDKNFDTSRCPSQVGCLVVMVIMTTMIFDSKTAGLCSKTD